MRLEFQPHNLFLKDIDFYLKNDPNLSNLEGAAYVLSPSLVREIPLSTPGIYILTGARQVGKTTLLKLIIKKLLLEEKIEPGRIFYLPCDIIKDYRELMSEMEQFFLSKPEEGYFYLFIDEVTYVKEWDRVIKHFADLGYFRRGCVLIPGSDQVILKEGMQRFPGRRGVSAKTDFHYYPLSFSEFVKLLEPGFAGRIEEIGASSAVLLKERPAGGLDIFDELLENSFINRLLELFNGYLLNGGFLTAINGYAGCGRINRHIYSTYVQWVLGDFIKRNKRENFLKDIILTISERLGKQISYHNITAVTDIQNHSTVREYAQILEDMDIFFVQQALREDKLKAAPKKLKKIHFSDPFIAASLICWARDVSENWDFVEKNIAADGQLRSDIIEGTISSLFKRKYKTFYIKAEAEVDLAVIIDRTFYPIEIKYTKSLRKSDLKQILKYKNGIIGYKGSAVGKFEHLYVLPLPVLALFV
jgi:hypothetical protein